MIKEEGKKYVHNEAPQRPDIKPEGLHNEFNYRKLIFGRCSAHIDRGILQMDITKL